MSAAATADAGAPPKGKKKLLVMIIAAVVVLAIAGVGAMLMMKKKPADDGEDGEGADHAPAKVAAVKHDPKAVPTFVPLEPFTVNLSDREAERYAQVGLTLEVSDPKVGDQIKTYMPAIRNNILMALADKSAAQLMDRDGKAKLAEQIRRETARAMGYDVEDPDEDDDAHADDDAKPKKKKKKKKKVQAELPITGVHFSNFIIQ